MLWKILIKIIIINYYEKSIINYKTVRYVNLSLVIFLTKKTAKNKINNTTIIIKTWINFGISKFFKFELSN